MLITFTTIITTIGELYQADKFALTMLALIICILAIQWVYNAWLFKTGLPFINKLPWFSNKNNQQSNKETLVSWLTKPTEQKNRQDLKQYLQEVDDCTGHYRRFLRKFLNISCRIFGRPQKNGKTLWDYMTTNAFNEALRIATIYPIFVAVGIWVLTSQSLNIAGLVVEEQSIPKLWGVLLWCGCAWLGYIWPNLTGSLLLTGRFWLIFVIFLTMVFTMVFASKYMGVTAMLFLTMFSALFGYRVLPIFAVGFAVSFYVIFFANNYFEIDSLIVIAILTGVAVAWGMFAIDSWLEKKHRALYRNNPSECRVYYISYLVILIVAIVVVVAGILNTKIPNDNDSMKVIIDQFHLVSLMLLLLPLCNGVSDWLSLSATRWLLRKTLAGKGVIDNLLLDGIIAIGCAILVTLMTFLTIYSFNYITGSPVFNIKDHADAIIKINADNFWDTMSQHGWLILCMYTTLLPSVMHISSVLMSACGGINVITDLRGLAKKINRGDFLGQSKTQAMHMADQLSRYMDISSHDKPIFCDVKKMGLGKTLHITSSSLFFILASYLMCCYGASPLFEYTLSLVADAIPSSQASTINHQVIEPNVDY